MTSEITPELFSTVPDASGRFGRFGGKFVAETLMSALADLEQLYADLKDDANFQREFDLDLAHYVGRPSPLYEAARLSDDIGGGRIFSEARRPESYGCPQGEQHYRSSASG